jgi:nucleotide-binding universal stress UspA family protein
MPEIKNVLCPVDFTELTRGELALAVDVCQAFGARLVLHHNLEAPPPGLTRVWEWNEQHRTGEISEPEAERRLRGLIAELPAGVDAQAALSRGPVGAVLLELARTLPADVVVLGTHGCSNQDHTSLGERMIDACPCPVLTIANGAHVEPFRLRSATPSSRTPVVVATDLSEAARRAVQYAIELARAAPLHLHLLHVMPTVSGQASVDHALRELNVLAKMDPAVRMTCHVEFGEPVKTIVRFGDEVDAGFLVMGEHARGLLRLLLRDTARGVLHRASRPVWYVPPRR